MFYLALASLWNLLAGYAGLLSIGQHAYVGLGGLLASANVKNANARAQAERPNAGCGANTSA